MSNITINNPNITKRQSINNQDYFIIYDNDNQQAYFVFENKLQDKSLWNDLVSNYSQIKEIWLEFEDNAKGKQVINLNILNSDNDLFV